MRKWPFALGAAAAAPTLEDVTLSVHEGEILGVTGLRRSGIREIAQLLAGRIPITSGEFRIDGEPVAYSSEAEALRLGVAYLPELGVEESELPLSAALAGEQDEDLTFAEEAKRLREVIRTVQQYGVNAESLRQRVGELSGGDQQKLTLARTLSQVAELFVLDQPTRGLDAKARLDVYELIDGLTAGGCSVILISSDMSELISRCGRIAVLRDGRLVDIYPNDGLTEDTVMMLSLGYDWFEEKTTA